MTLHHLPVAHITANAGYKALHIAEAQLADNLADAERLEGTIADMVAELRDSPGDWREGALLMRLASARQTQREHIAEAAYRLREAEGLREKLGLERSVLARVFGEWKK